MDMSERRFPENAELRDFLSRPGAANCISVHNRDDDIFVQGQAAESIFYILAGRVKVVASRHGKEFILGVSGAGQFFGEGALNGPCPRLVSVRAMELSRLISFPIATMREAMEACPGLAELFTAHLLSRNRRIEADLVDKILNSNEIRLARLLLILANFHGESGLPIAPVHFNQKTLAEMLGGNRSRVSAFMNKFRRLGFISYRDGKIDVHRGLLTALQGTKS